MNKQSTTPRVDRVGSLIIMVDENGESYTDRGERWIRELTRDEAGELATALEFACQDYDNEKMDANERSGDEKTEAEKASPFAP